MKGFNLSEWALRHRSLVTYFMLMIVIAGIGSYFKLGRKIAFFGDGFQQRIERHGRKLWWIPTLGGEFILDRRFGSGGKFE